jgi:hypothetical protein
MKLFLQRVGEYDGATYGVLLFDGRPRFVTLEEAWRENRRNVSCIPVGKYRCVEFASRRFGGTYLVEGVVGRSGILFHAGNTAKDTQGCILVGTSFSNVSGGGGIVSSGLAFSRFLQLLKGVKSFDLEVR